jgi:NADPH:quinone reductase-like Zn-dependent oxidoreductase
LFASGTITPVIDRSYGLREAAEAIRYVEQGHTQGKVIVSPAENR